MTRANLYEEIFRGILNSHADIFDNVTDISSELELNGLTNALEMALADTGISGSNFKRLIESLLYKINDDDINDYSTLSVGRATYLKPSNKRVFIWHSKELSVINCDIFFQGNSLDSDNLLLIVEQICYTEQNRSEFLDYIKDNTDKGINDYYVIYDPNKFQSGDVWKLYMYGLCLYLNNGNKFHSDKSLIYTQTVYNKALTYNDKARYDQYIDIYDVIAEWNDCSDVLSAFLKMYQVLEYIIYRKELVEIVKNANIKQSFVRQIKWIDQKFTKNERDMFISGFKNIFPTFHGVISATLITSDIEEFCSKYYSLSSKGNIYMTSTNIKDENQVDSCIAKFIYDTRCSIVHNKESEFHITAINYMEYASIVPLVKELLGIIGKSLFELISSSNNNITFDVPTLNLY